MTRLEIYGARLICIACLFHVSCKPLVDAMNARAEANRTVTVVVEGAVFGPVDAAGRTWDRRPLPEGYSTEFLTVVAARYPAGVLANASGATALAGAVADDLISRFNNHYFPPDPLGVVSILISGRSSGEYALPKQANTFTPTWSVLVPNVPIHRARVVVSFKDSDFTADRPMAKVVMGERDLLAAEESGGVFVLDTSQQTGGAVLRLLLSVYPDA